MTAALPVTRPQAEYDPSPVSFESLDLEPRLLDSIRQRGFVTTTPIQSAVVPIIMDGDDLIGCAETGTGKTAAFLLPILNRLLRTRAAAPEERGYTRVLILSPTRELAVQIEDDVQGFSYHTDLTSIAVYGGVPMDQQERALKSGVDIIVATPGRLMDHMRNGAVSFDKLDTLVLDEADRMMDMGFWPDVRRIVSTLPDTAARQTLLFSATMPAEVMKLADEVLCDAKYVQIGIARRTRQEHHPHGGERRGSSEDRVAREVPPADRRARARVRPHQVGRRAARPQAGRIRPEGGVASRRSHPGPAARRPWKDSAAGGSACSSPPTWRRAVWISTASRTSSITKCPRTGKPTFIAWGGLDARMRPAPR